MRAVSVKSDTEVSAERPQSCPANVPDVVTGESHPPSKTDAVVSIVLRVYAKFGPYPSGETIRRGPYDSTTGAIRSYVD